MPSRYPYQLVLQLSEDCPLTSLDFEDDIAEALGNPLDEPGADHIVDGNEFGGGTIRFFIHTNEPTAAFALCRPLLASRGLLQWTTAAWCSCTDHKYEVIWPEHYPGRFAL